MIFRQQVEPEPPQETVGERRTRLISQVHDLDGALENLAIRMRFEGFLTPSLYHEKTEICNKRNAALEELAALKQIETLAPVPGNQCVPQATR